MTKTKLLAGCLALVFLAIAFNTAASISNWSTINGNADATCKIQKRGLSAQPHLTRAMGDIAFLLTPPPNQKIPPGKSVQYRELGDLQHQLEAYVGIEQQQPKHRKCQ